MHDHLVHVKSFPGCQSSEKLHPIRASRLIFRAIKPELWRPCFPTRCTTAAKRKTGGLRTVTRRRVGGIKETGNKGVFLKNCPCFDRRSLKRFEKRSKVFRFALAKKQRSLHGFEPFTACTSDHSWCQRAKSGSSPTDWEQRTRKLSSGCRRQAMAGRANSSDLEIYWTTHVVNMPRHRQSCVSVDPDIFYMAFECNVMPANYQVVFLRHCDPFTKFNQNSFGSPVESSTLKTKKVVCLCMACWL